MTEVAGGAAVPPRSGGTAGPSWSRGEVERGQRRLHLLALALCLGLVAGALALAPVSPGGDEGLSFAGQRLPEVCSFKRVTGLPCPGCGLTRSWVSALHGDLRSSLGHHSLGWLVLAYVVAQVLRHGLWLSFPAKRPSVEAAGRHLDRGVILLGLLLLVAWVPTLVRAVTG